MLSAILLFYLKTLLSYCKYTYIISIYYNTSHIPHKNSNGKIAVFSRSAQNIHYLYVNAGIFLNVWQMCYVYGLTYCVFCTVIIVNVYALDKCLIDALIALYIVCNILHKALLKEV